jgi:alkylation response protein AidB-like acyl-CoA dehydrogenase
MKFEFSAEDEAFRAEVRAYFASELPPDIAADVRRWKNPLMGLARRWQRHLVRRGWGAPHWPKEHGGQDWSAFRKHIFMQELYRACAPDYMWQGLHMMGPVFMAFGTAEQQARFLPPMLAGDEVWAQGFSEPGAGSDLASLKTSAVLDDGHWRLNGQKIWTSDAADCDWGFFLVRTDAAVKPQRGLSFVVVKLDTPGLTIRPIQSIDGRAELNEVFLDNVRVPRSQLVGAPGQGWTMAKYLLEKERTASAFLYYNQRCLAKVKDLASRVQVGGVPLLQSQDFARRVAVLEADLLALEWSVLRILAEEQFEYDVNAVVSVLKVKGSEFQQRVTAMHLEALGTR